jgi:PPOX class probable F420-dependent enzyme
VIKLSAVQANMLAAARSGHLATADAAGAPHVIPVCYAFDGRSIYSVLDRKPKRVGLIRLRRVRNIQANPEVALVVDHYEEDWSNLRYILVTGRAELLLAGAERAGAVHLLRQKYPQYRDMDIELNPVIKITPAIVVAWGAGLA